MRYNITTTYIDFYGLVHSELIRNGHYDILRHVKMTLHELVCDNLVCFVVLCVFYCEWHNPGAWTCCVTMP